MLKTAEALGGGLIASIRVDGHDSDVSNDSEIHNLSNEEVLEF